MRVIDCERSAMKKNNAKKLTLTVKTLEPKALPRDRGSLGVIMDV